MKKILGFVVALCAIVGLASCGGSDNGKVYFLNFKPEAIDAYKKVAEKFTEETGIEIKIETAASGEYENQLKSEIIKDDAPTLFSINGPVGYQNWSDYILDLSGEKIYTDYLSANGKNMAVKDGKKVAAIPVTVEGYGLVYNKTVFTEYFAQTGKASTLSSVDDIDSFDDLKVIIEDLTKYIDGTKATTNAPTIDELTGAFATCLKSGSQWPYQTHTANIPFYYEFLEANSTNATLGGISLDTVEFKYANEYQNIFDLYINNDVQAKTAIPNVDYDTAVAEFATEKAAIIQQGNWVYDAIAKAKGASITASEVGMMPIFTGHEGESAKSICVGTENYWCVNNEASKADRKASIKFMEWLFSSDAGKKLVVEDLKFIAPFSTFKETELPTDPLAKEVIKFMNDTDRATIDWSFQAFPSEDFKNLFGAALVEYAKGEKTMAQVKKVVVDAWAAEKEKNK